MLDCVAHSFFQGRCLNTACSIRSILDGTALILAIANLGILRLARTFALTGLATLASAHMKMANPVPFNQAKLNNGPLEPNGSNFPCKFGDAYAYATDASNVYAQGSTQKLEFIGQAVHGGGSCQVSVTTDVQPTKKSVWKVIKSIEGGCPAKNMDGNAGNNADAKNPFTYDFTIPKELASGNYTLAWTWFNRIGNREMYMNCAPLTVTGSGGSQSFVDGLPDMFVANVGNGCGTVDSKDVKFPNPGKDVDNFGAAGNAAAPTGGCQAGNGGSGGGSGSGSGNPASSTSGPVSPSSQPTTHAPASQPTTAPLPDAPKDSCASSVPGGVFIQSQPSGPAQTQPQQTQPQQTQPQQTQPQQTQPQQTGPVVASASIAKPTPINGSSPAPTDGPGNSGSSPSGSFSAGMACSSEGAWNCIGGTSFQRCASGMWSAAQPVAAGTSCTPGQASQLKVAAKQKRTHRRAIRFAA
ncbi:hypothetical protein C2857_005250 [Epichloe festucae Fl1]|uniref:Lytic polysaccharide monooxygenase n=1 Tax=Epichloe festucae (strain Fl1) TaxID=877507 RepID=A0A7S9PU29_EPIFF|nr:hypothetical protein C2857_005250 [Epichloe festucae Fl1]